MSVARMQIHRHNSFSQSGEDGLLKYLLSKLPNRNRWCVEFGAWDGQRLSNCYKLIRDSQYKAVLIELESDRYDLLTQVMASFDVLCLNRQVGFEETDSLDDILSTTPIPLDFDLLSIDIDGDDYRVWEAVHRYTPKVVIIEINIRDLPGVERVNVSGTPVIYGVSGNSITTINALAAAKGYALVAMVGCNTIYVQRELLPLFHPNEPSADDVFTYEGHAFKELNLHQKFRKAQVLALTRIPRLFKLGSYLG